MKQEKRLYIEIPASLKTMFFDDVAGVSFFITIPEAHRQQVFVYFAMLRQELASRLAILDTQNHIHIDITIGNYASKDKQKRTPHSKRIYSTITHIEPKKPAMDYYSLGLTWDDIELIYDLLLQYIANEYPSGIHLDIECNDGNYLVFGG